MHRTLTPDALVPLRARVMRCLGLLALLLLAAVQVPAHAAEDSKGTEFWLMFNENVTSPTLSLFITGDIATNGVVSVPGIGFSAPFSVTPGAITTVIVPIGAHVTAENTVTNQGVRVVANAEVTVYGLNRAPATTDAFLALPVDILGTSYINLGYRNVNVVNASQLGVVGTAAGTVVTITPSVAAGSRPAGVPFTISLNPGQTFQLTATGSQPADLSGTLISSTAPIAVFGGHRCANIPAGSVACDHIVEQLPPTTTWGRSFVTMPLATRTRGDTFRVLASTAGTQVSINGAVVATLNRGQFHEQIITGPARITATQPVLVAQYSNSSSFDDVTSDPFMMLIPPFEQFLASYTVTTPASGFSANFINVVVPNAAIGALLLDGVAVPASSYRPIPGTAFSGAQLRVSLGTHTLASPLPFGAFMYGFDSFDSYGYPGGYSLSQVAVVSTLSLAPPTAALVTGTQHCVNATLRDQNGNAVSGVRVDFSVSGVNPQTGFANANTSGVARYCYTGSSAGDDTIVASLGSLSATATANWRTIAVCDINRDSAIDIFDIGLIRNVIGQTAAPNDPRDANADGRITINDVRFCTLRCTRASCSAN